MSLSREELSQIADEVAEEVCPNIPKPALKESAPSVDVINYIVELRDAHTPEDQKYLTLSTPTKIRDEYEKLGKAKVREIEKSYPAKLSIQSMKDWMKAKIDTGDPQECKPCLLAPIINWYYEELKEKGVDELAAELQEAADFSQDESPEKLLIVCAMLDEIKKSVDEHLANRLLQFDAKIQNMGSEGDTAGPPADIVRIYVAEHCPECADIKRLLTEGKFVVDGAEGAVDMIDLETEEGFERWPDFLDGIPRAYLGTQQCTMEIDTENDTLIIKCGEEEDDAGSDQGA
jgi:hypothetical protein